MAIAIFITFVILTPVCIVWGNGIEKTKDYTFEEDIIHE